MTNYREILRLNAQGVSQRSIAKLCECSRNTVSRTLKRAENASLSWPLPKNMTDEKLLETLIPKKEFVSSKKMPDYEYIHKELSKPGVTLNLLWNEYCQSCRNAKIEPYMYTQFCKYYREFALTNKAAMHIHRKPGEALEVDWAGQTAEIFDSLTGELRKAYIFVATLPSSQYTYVEAFLSMDLESWITAHINAFAFLGGVPKTLIPDNLKASITKASKYDPILNKTYSEMAEHYATVVMPARVRKPRDKNSVESNVGNISTWILAAIRNEKFFSLNELNVEIRLKLDDYNRKPFQKRPMSRFEAFENEEKLFLAPLPKEAYEMATWKVATVQFNYHVSVEKMHYSVPYEYLKHKVDIRTTRRTIEVFYNNTRIASHPRLRGRIGQYSTSIDHMPENHKSKLEWNSERFIAWAETVGASTSVVIAGVLNSHMIEQQGYKSCMGILKLGDKYGLSRLESACKKALSYTPRPSYKSISLILQNGQDKISEEPIKKSKTSKSQEHAFTRGASYYGGKSSC